MASRCTPANAGSARSVSLPVLDGDPGQGPRLNRSRIGPWRATALIVLHLLMIAHIIQWLVMGTTLSPIEPSETMETLERGFINAGAIFFGLALILTLVFGRYICGWACHVVALQDFCHWLMVKVGIRPKPFRSRLLIFVPLVLGTYMFIWPSFKRLILQPAVEAVGLDWPWWLRRSEPMFGMQNELFVEDFWASFPEWYIAIPFLLVCGFATVYILGAKGFCTYACPYGGLFALAEPVAPVRVRVNHDKCHQCGHCTAACTSNVRVHEEIRDYGMVIDAGCMRTMDCISVCPNDALSIGLGRPAVGARVPEEARERRKQARAKRRYDMSWRGELAAAAVFFVLFIATRGMFDRVPMLMAGGLAAVGTGLTVLFWKMATDQNARLHRLLLKHKGRITRSGIAFAVLMLAGWALAGWGGVGNVARWRGDTNHAGVGIPVDTVMRPEFAPSQTAVDRARTGLEWYSKADSFDRGGIGWTLSPDDEVRRAYLHTVLGEYAQATDALRRVVDRGNPTDPLVFQLLAVHAQSIRVESVGVPAGPDRGAIIQRGNDEQIEIMRTALDKHPALHEVRLRLSQMLFNMGSFDWSIWDGVDDADVLDDPKFHLNRGQIHALHGERDKMGEILDRVLAMDSKRPEILLEASQLAGSLGRTADASRLLDLALERAHDAPTFMSAARIAARAGRIEDTRALVTRALEADGGGRPGIRFEAGRVFLSLGETERGRAMMLDAADDLRHDRWQYLGVASALAGAGLETPDDVLLEDGLARLASLTENHPDEPVFLHDRAGWLFSAGRQDEAADLMIRAAEMAPANPVLAERTAQILRAAGREEEAARWFEETASRRIAP